jgi:FkbM family methyltransferase
MIIQRIKVVKELLLLKLDTILSRLEIILSQLEPLHQFNQFRGITHKNQNALMEASVHLLEAQNSQQLICQEIRDRLDALATTFSTSADVTLPLLRDIQALNQKLNQDHELTSQDLSIIAKDVLQQLELIQRQRQEVLQQIESLQRQQELIPAQVLAQFEQSIQLVSKTLLQQIDTSSKNQQDILQKLVSEKIQEQIEPLLQSSENINEQRETLEKQFLNQAETTGSISQRIVVKTNRSTLLHPELELMKYLYSYLPSRTAIDIGAHIGEVSANLLEVGYEVYAFEPYPPVFEQLCDRLRHYKQFHPHKFAIGSTDGILPLHIAEDCSEAGYPYGHPSLFNTLLPHTLPTALQFTRTVQVPVRSLSSLHQSMEIPCDVGLVKIDTEGFDAEVMNGMGDFNYSVVIAEFWDEKHAFGQSQTANKLKNLVSKMRQRHYHWHIVIHRTGLYDASFYCNYPESVEESWGNVFFFQSHHIFMQAMKWCAAVLPETYFVGAIEPS